MKQVRLSSLTVRLESLTYLIVSERSKRFLFPPACKNNLSRDEAICSGFFRTIALATAVQWLGERLHEP
jgi:hypothetical protein